MKRSQRTLLDRITKAIENGRKKGYLQTSGTIYGKFDGDESKEFACAYGALAAGLDIDIVPPNGIMHEDYLGDIVTQVNEKLGIHGLCATFLYPIIYVANDSSRAFHNRDAYAIEILKNKLENDPEFCADEE